MWWTIAMSKEHPDAEAFVVLGSVCNVGTVTLFAFHSHQWLVLIPLLQPYLGCVFALCDDFCLYVSWVWQNFLFHQCLSSSSSFPCIVLTQSELGGCLQLSPLISSLLYLMYLWSQVPLTTTPLPCQITATYLLSVQVLAALSIYSLYLLLPFPTWQSFCFNPCGIGQMIICTFFLNHLFWDHQSVNVKGVCVFQKPCVRDLCVFTTKWIYKTLCFLNLWCGCTDTVRQLHLGFLASTDLLWGGRCRANCSVGGYEMPFRALLVKRYVRRSLLCGEGVRKTSTPLSVVRGEMY